MTHIFNILRRMALATLSGVALLAACTAEEVVPEAVSGAGDEAKTYTYRAYIDAAPPTFDGDATTRAGAQWNNGQKIFFYAAGVCAAATYDATTGSWEITSKQQLPTTNNATVTAHHFVDFDNYINDGFGVQTSYRTQWYCDQAAKFTHREGEAVYLTTHLKPNTFRMRFTGTPGTQFTLSAETGFQYLANVVDVAVSPYTEDLQLTIGNDGYSEYVYAVPSDEQRTLVITSADNTYRRTLPASVFQRGKTSRLALPTTDNYNDNNWEKETSDTPNPDYPDGPYLIPVTPQETTITVGQSVRLEVEGSNPNRFSWQRPQWTQVDANGNFIKNLQRSEYFVTLYPTPAGTYYYNVVVPFILIEQVGQENYGVPERSLTFTVHVVQ